MLQSRADLILVDAVTPDFTVAGFAQQIRAATAGQGDARSSTGIESRTNGRS
jgi:hypothetical protein